jgi:hypothetical protein
VCGWDAMCFLGCTSWIFKCNPGSVLLNFQRYDRRILIFSVSAAHRRLWPPRHTRFLYHIQRRATVGRTSLDEWSVRRRDLYLTTHTTDKHPYTRWDSNPRSQPASGRWPRLRPRCHWDRHDRRIRDHKTHGFTVSNKISCKLLRWARDLTPFNVALKMYKSTGPGIENCSL